MYSLFATGEMDYCPRGGCKARSVTPDMGWPLVTRVGDGIYSSPFYGRRLSTLNYAGKSGDLYMGYREGPLQPNGNPLRPEYYRDDTGSFRVDIIVWAREDYDAMVGFLEDLSGRDPENRALTDGVLYTRHLHSVYAGAQKAKEAIEATEKEIAALKVAEEKPKEKPGKAEDAKSPAGSSPSAPVAFKTGKASAPPSTPSVKVAKDGPGEDRETLIAALEARLAKLQEMVTEFDRMKEELAEEREKSEQLAQEIGEMAQREEDLRTRLEKGARTPPVVVIASPEDGGTVEVNIIGLKGVVEDDEGIERIEIFINGRRLERGNARGLRVSGGESLTRHDLLERIPLQEGENRIRVRAVDREGLATEKTVTLHCARKRKNIWAVVVGINDYAHTRPLRYAVNDALAFHRHLTEHVGIPDENILLLLDREANLTRLRSALGTHLKTRAGEDDMVIIYFAGHGATERDVMSPDGDGLEKYLLPQDADLKDLYASALPMREVRHVFNRIRSERLVFIADACYSGASGGRTVGMSGGLRASLSEDFLDRIASGKGRVILSASGANEVSEEDEKIGHGVFTFHLLKGLQGAADADGDGLITVDEAYGYVSRKVPDATGQEQHPVKKGTVEGRLVLGICR